MRRTYLARLAVVLVCACAAALTGCSGGEKPASPTPSSGASTPVPVTHPFTGLRRGVHHRVLAAKIDNTRAGRPQYGLRRADIVYVEQVEGGISRIMGVYSSRLPRRVGPVRSARISDLHLLRQFGRPAFAYSGAQGKLKPGIARAPLYDVSPPEHGAPYLRGDARPVPYNLFADPAKLLAEAPHASRAHDIGFTFGAAPPGGRPRRHYTVRYPHTTFTFTWSSRARRWLASIDGAPDTAAEGGRLGAPTIVVQWVKTTRSRFHDFLGNYTPLIHATGKGTAVVLRDGKSYHARWSRPSRQNGTTFTTRSGRPMNFHRGQVWVLLAARHPHIP